MLGVGIMWQGRPTRELTHKTAVPATFLSSAVSGTHESQQSRAGNLRHRFHSEIPAMACGTSVAQRRGMSSVIDSSIGDGAGQFAIPQKRAEAGTNLIAGFR